MKKIILTSTGFENNSIKEKFLELLNCDATNAKVLFIITAANDPDAVRILSKCLNDLTNCDIPDENIAVYDMHKALTQEEINRYDAIYVCGGSTEYLVDRISELNFKNVIDKYIENGGIYIGVSAGSVAASGNYPNGLCFIENNLDVHCENGTKNGKIDTNEDIYLTNNQAIFINGDENIIFEQNGIDEKDDNDTLNTYNKIAFKYEEEYGKDLSDTPYIDMFLKEVNGNNILDIGCGTGTLSEYIANKKYNVDAIDFSEEMLKIARRRIKNVSFMQMDMRKIDVEKKYNGIMLAYSLFHISKNEVKEVLPKYYNLLEEDGVMLIILQDGQGETYVEENLEKGLKKFVNFYSFEEIEQVLNDSGFKVIEKMRKKSISEFSLQNDKLVIVCRKEGYNVR